MKTCTRLLVAGLAVWALSSGPAWGGIANGDFSDGLTWWVAEPTPPGALVLVEVVGEQLHMRVENNYVYDSGWQLQEGDVSQAQVSQNVAPNGGAPLGTTALQFDAYVRILDNPEGNNNAMAVVGVNYGDLIVDVAEEWFTVASTEGKEMQTITINLPDLVEDGPVLDLYVYAVSRLDPLPAPADPGTTYNIIVDATFDNFTFIPGDSGVVPEPLTIFSAMLAVGGIGAYLRRRTGPAA